MPCWDDLVELLKGHDEVLSQAVAPQDERLRDEIFRTKVQPQWLQRCGADCAALWRSTIGSVRSIALPTVP